MNNIEITIETATTSDAEKIAEIEQLCFSVPWSGTSVREFIENPLAVMITAKANGSIVGYVGLYSVADEADIANVAVIPEYRRCGIAKALITQALLYSKEKGIKKLMLEVRASNIAAINLYKSFGFICVGTRKNYYTQPKEDALLMDKSIDGQDSDI